jgi:hypothetical protein
VLECPLRQIAPDALEQRRDSLIRCRGQNETGALEFRAPLTSEEVALGEDRQQWNREGGAQAGELLERGHGSIRSRMQVQDQVHLAGGGQRDFTHSLLHEVSGVEQSGQIVEDVLGIAVGADPGDRQTGGLRLWAYDGEVLTDQSVEQGGFAGIGRAGERNVACPGWHASR